MPHSVVLGAIRQEACQSISFAQGGVTLQGAKPIRLPSRSDGAELIVTAWKRVERKEVLADKIGIFFFFLFPR